MFDGRIYRAALVPLLFVIVIVGFSVTGREAPLGSTLAPDAFDGARAFAQLRSLAARFPERRPGGAGDARLARYVAGAIASAAGGAGGGFQVSTRTVKAQTVDGERTLRTVLAMRPGSTGESPIAIVAHRDAAARGSAAELSGTAALIELARVFAHSETRRTIVLVSTSGGSGGYGGAADFAAHAPDPLDAAIVLGDLAGVTTHQPLLLDSSGRGGRAPDGLIRTLASAVSQEAATKAGEAGFFTQLAHLALPFSLGEQAPLDAAGVPAALVQVDGERAPSRAEGVSEARLEGYGRAVLSAVYALDEGPDVKRSLGGRLALGRKTLPAWAIRLLAFALLLAPSLACLDALARVRRRGERLLRWLPWIAACVAPFLAAAAFAVLLGRLGAVAAPGGGLSPAALAADGSALPSLLAVALVAVLALAVWPALVRGLSLPARPGADAAGLAAMLVLLAVGWLAWLANPFAALLVVAPAHLWLLACEPGERPRAVALAAVLASLLPAVLLAFVYAHGAGLGLGGFLESVVLAFAGGQAGLFAALLTSVGLGCLLAIVALRREREPLGGGTPVPRPERIATRGPLTYAGPGSLGGTESALRR